MLKKFELWVLRVRVQVFGLSGFGLRVSAFKDWSLSVLVGVSFRIYLWRLVGVQDLGLLALESHFTASGLYTEHAQRRS